MRALDPVVAFAGSPHARVRPVGLSSVRWGDGFWGQRAQVNRAAGIPHGLGRLRETGSLEAFDIAAGKSSAEPRGFVYRDSDTYKWLEAASFTLGKGADDQLRSDVDCIVAAIAGAQDADGYLNTSFCGERKRDRFTNLESGHEIYCAGHLIQAAIAHHRATRSTALLDVAKRLADHLYRVFGPSGRVGACGHPCAEMALVELYRETDEARYLALAQRFIDARGREPRVLGGGDYLLGHLPFREQREAVGHAVRAVYLYAGAADLYLETGEEALLDALEGLFQDVRSGKTYVTGGVGSRHEGEAFGDRYELPNARAYCETCAAIGCIMWHWRMFAITADPKFIDAIELALYNGFLSGPSLDGESYFYVNPLLADGKHRRQPWYSCACCPPNIYRTLSSVQGMFFATDQNGIYCNLYDNCAFDDGAYRIAMETDYPWSGEVSIEIGTETDFELRLRIPAWCRKATATAPGGRASLDAQPGSYLRIARTWRAGDRVTLHLDMPVETVYPHPRIAENRGCVALKRGPLVYCIEGADNPGLPLLDASIDLSKPIRHDLRGDLLGGIEAITFTGAVPQSDPSRVPLYVGKPQRLDFREIEMVAIPYHAWANREPGQMKVWLPTLQV